MEQIGRGCEAELQGEATLNGFGVETNLGVKPWGCVVGAFAIGVVWEAGEGGFEFGHLGHFGDIDILALHAVALAGTSDDSSVLAFAVGVEVIIDTEVCKGKKKD